MTCFQKMLIGFVAIQFVFACKKNSKSDPPTEEGPVVVYAAGYLYDSTAALSVPCYWKDGVRIPLSMITGSNSGRATALFVSGGDCYVAGYNRKADNIYVPCYWRNGVRTDLPKTDETKDGQAIAMYISGNDVYVAGSNDSSASTYYVRVPIPCYWKNGTRVSLSMLSQTGDGRAGAITISGNDVYIAGYTKDATTGKGVPCYWKNGIRTDLSKLDNTKWAEAQSIFITGNNVYVCGEGYNPANAQLGCFWKNGVRTDFDKNADAEHGSTSGIAVNGNDVYISGHDLYDNKPGQPYYWKNGTCVNLSTAGYDGGEGRCIFVKGSDVYVGGAVNNADWWYKPCYWKNGQRIDLDITNGSNRTQGSIQSIFIATK